MLRHYKISGVDTVNINGIDKNMTMLSSEIDGVDTVNINGIDK